MKGLIFTYILTYGGATAGLFQPFTGFLAYVCLSIIKPESLWFWSVPSSNYSRTVAIGFFIGWTARGFGRWDLGRAGAVVMALVGFWSWMLLSAIASPDPDHVWRPQGTVDVLTKAILPALVGLSLIDSTAKLKQLTWTILLSMGYVALEFNLHYLSGWNRLLTRGFGGMDNNCNAIALVTCVGLAFFLGLHAASWWQRAVAFGVAVLIVHSILFSFSRGGMIALPFTCVAAFLLIPKKPQHYAAFVLGVAATILMAGPQVREEFLTIFAKEEERDESAASRVVLWKGCLRCMADRPLFGVGPDLWIRHSAAYSRVEGYRNKQAHTLWLQLGAEMGIPALAMLLTFYGLCMARLWPLSRENSPLADPWHRYLSRMVIASLVGFIVSAQFVSLSRLELPYYVALIGLGVLKVDSITRSV